MKTLIVTLILTGAFYAVIGQDVGGSTLISQSRTTSANIGNCDITIKYHSPNVNGRKIFGGIVPYNFVVEGMEYPWRAGSNQRTTIEFSHDVKINGIPLAAGNYGFLALVNEDKWTLIFSSGKSWGAFNYTSENDVLRVDITPEKIAFQEWLSYNFLHPKAEEVHVQLHWANTSASFHVSTNAIENALMDLKNKEDKSAADYQDLAQRLMENNSLEEALNNIEISKPLIETYEEQAYRDAYTFNYEILKGKILHKMGEENEGQALIQAALSHATGFDVYYYALNLYTREAKHQEAKTILIEQIERNPENFQNHFAFGEYYLKENDQENATAHFKKAYELTIAQDSGWQNYARYLYLQNKLALNN